MQKAQISALLLIFGLFFLSILKEWRLPNHISCNYRPVIHFKLRRQRFHQTPLRIPFIPNRQLADEGKRLPPGATHQVARDAQGRQQVVRRRFSAV